MKNTLILASFALAIVIMPAITKAADRACTMQYAPVCGTLMSGEYKTFGNSCTMAGERAIYQHEGECTQAELRGSVPSNGDEYVPPAHCVAWNDGCNSCARQGNGMAACTMMACMGEPRAGYCTKYADANEEEDSRPATKPAPAATSGPASSASPSAGASSDGPGPSEAVVPAAEEDRPGFFVRMWTSVSSWFGNLF